MANDTKNSLTDFDMCLAVAQVAIDSQVAAAWKEWVARSEFSMDSDAEAFGNVSIFPLNPKTGKPSSLGLRADLAPLTVSLNVEAGKLGQVRVTLHLESGEVHYFDEVEEKTASCPVKNWTVSFITDLDKQPVDLETLRKIDPKASAVADEAIRATGLPDSVFSIEYLFMKFTDVDLLLSGNKDVKIPEDVPKGAREKALSSLNSLLHAEATGKFMLGTVVRRSKSRSTGPLPTFALTDFIFSVFSDPAAPQASTLTYLGMFSGSLLPSDINVARLNLKDNWVRPAMLDGREGLISGVFAISKHTFLERYLVPEFTKALGVQPRREGLKWTFEQAGEQGCHKKTIIHQYVKLGHKYRLELTVVPGGNQLRITGRLNAYFLYDGYTLDMGLWGPQHIEWIHYEGHRDIHSSVVLMAKGGAAGFSINMDIPDVRYFGELVVDNKTVRGLTQVTEAVSSVMKGLKIIGNTPAEILSSGMKSQLETLTSKMNRILKDIDVSLNQQAFIPPGGGVFTFQNLRFSDAGDLLLDVIYKAP